MANQNAIADLDTTPANNLNFRGQSMQGSAPVSTIDNMFQKQSAMLAALYDSIGGSATAAGTTALTVTITDDWTAYAHGLFLAIKTASAATGASTLVPTVPTAGALASKKIRRQGDTAIQANDWLANATILLKYDSAYDSAAGAWVLLNPASSIATPLPEASGGTNQTTYTQGDLLYASAANTLSKLAKGTTGQSLTQTATIPAWGSPVTLATSVASTSGTAIDFTGLPAGIRVVWIEFVGVSTNGTSNVMVQIGDSGGIEATGYLGSVVNALGAAANFTTGFGYTQSTAAAGIMHGTVALILENVTNNTWVSSGIQGRSDTANVQIGAASKSLSPGPLDRVRITMVNGTDAFDAGEINIGYL